MWFLMAALVAIGGILFWYCGSLGFWIGIPMVLFGAVNLDDA